ncbi:hypothetical protein D3C72_1699870 [compost metagenome]
MHPFTPGRPASPGDIQLGITQVVLVQRLADLGGEAALLLAVLRQTEATDVAIHHLLHAAVWHVVGTGLVETYRHLGIGH